MPTCSYRPAAQLRQALLDGAELALIDVREEADFARSHPLFAPRAAPDDADYRL